MIDVRWVAGVGTGRKAGKVKFVDDRQVQRSDIQVVGVI
jgi:hypothetical protein